MESGKRSPKERTSHSGKCDHQMDNNEESANTTDFLDAIASDHRSPSEIFEAEMRERSEEAVPDKVLQAEALHPPCEKPVPELLQEEKLDADARNTGEDSVPVKTHDETARYAALLVREPQDNQEAGAAEAESVSNASGYPLTTCPPPMLPAESNPADLQTEVGIVENEAEDKDMGREQQGDTEGKGKYLASSEGVQAAPTGEKQLNLDAPNTQQHGAAGASGHAPEGTAASDTHGFVGRAPLQPHVIEKIPDLPREASGAAASADGQEAAQPTAATETTELVFRYKTPIGLTATLLFLTAVVLFTVTVGHLLHKEENQEEGGTTALIFPAWNKSESNRGQLLFPEDESERDILTLDVN